MPVPKSFASEATPAFHTTRWTVVMRARGDAADARAALGDLCEAYWMPVFRFLRREGRSKDQSQELAQEFFSRLLAGKTLEQAHPKKGRFRSYLLGALKHFLANQRRSEGRQKRGGVVVIESLNSDKLSSPGIQVPDANATFTDAYFDRHWALAVMERGLNTVHQSFDANGKTHQFELLKPWLMGEDAGQSQGEIASKLGMTSGAIKVAIHRLRQKFAEAIRREISETVDTEDEIAAELRYLIEALGNG